MSLDKVYFYNAVQALLLPVAWNGNEIMLFSCVGYEIK